MTLLTRISAFAILFMLATSSIAQPPGFGGPGFGPPMGPGGGGPPMGGFGGGGPPWGGGFGGGGRGEGRGGGGFDPSQFLTRMDTNGNGMLDPEEAQGPARFMLDRMARDNPKIDITKPIPMTTLTEAFQRMRGGGGPGGPGDGRSEDELVLMNDKMSLVAGFTTKVERIGVPGFGAMAETASNVRVEEQDLKEAEDRLKRYDKNNDQSLDESELKEGKWGDTPMQYDRNKDGKLTKQELATRQARRRSLKAEQEPKKDQSNVAKKKESTEEKKETPNPFEKTASYRLTDKDGKPLRSAGLPEWFIRNDTNFDNQISMSEFNRKWSDEVVQDFARFDTNNDGLITNKECLVAVKKVLIPGAMSTAPAAAPADAATTGAAVVPASASGGSTAAPADARMRAWASSKIKKIDKDNNSFLSPDEFKEGDFNAVDINKDGKIDLDEYVQFRNGKK